MKDLDFDDIVGSKQQAPAPVASQKTAKPAESPQIEKPKPLGYEVAIKGSEEGTFIFKDLADCSTDEFISWLEWVYPVGKASIKPEQFGTRIAKARAFEQVVRFHQFSFVSQNIKDNLDKTQH
jgi:hypothetical protein